MGKIAPQLLKLAVILGTRPEIVKMSPIIRECEKQDMGFFILHTGQHYSYELDGVFFEQLKLPEPKYNLGVGSGTYAEEVSKMLLGIEKILLEEMPSIVLVEGDTNTALSGALASSKCGIPIGHIEAGLRSYFSGMPEEINRVVVDHISNLLFAPTKNAKNILLNEGIPDDRIFVVGNTIVDAVRQNLDTLWDGSLFPFIPKQYVLATVHRQENVDNQKRLAGIIEGLQKVSVELQMPLVYPIHPRTKKKIAEFGLKTDGIQMEGSLDYLRFLWLEQNAKLILTDSGGVQEEACILGTPCVTLRDNTERPETVEVGANVLAGTSSEKIVECAKMMLGRSNSWANPFGDGKAAERIFEIVRRHCG